MIYIACEIRQVPFIVFIKYKKDYIILVYECIENYYSSNHFSPFNHLEIHTSSNQRKILSLVSFHII